MKTYDFIKAATGLPVYITSDGDLAMRGDLRLFIARKTPMILKGLSKGGLAILQNGDQTFYVPPRNVREVGH